MPKATVTVDGTVDEVFTLLADLTTHPTWSPDLLECYADHRRGPVGLGTRFRREIKGMGEGEVEITVWDEPKQVEFGGSDKMGDIRHLFALTSESERTKVDQVLEMRLRGFWRLLTLIMSIMLGRGARRNANRAQATLPR